MPPFTKSRSIEKKGAAPSSSSSSNNAAGTNTTDDFSARRSARVAANAYAADNDTWVEALAVCEIPVKPGYGDKPSSNATDGSSSKKNGGLFRKFKSKNSFNEKETDNKDTATKKKDDKLDDADVAAASQRLTLRPYFQSQNTGQRVWDEPPSGASKIIYATPEARRMATAQLEEMRSTYAHAAVIRRQEREEKKALEAAMKMSEGGSGSGSKLSLPRVFSKRLSATASSTRTIDTTSQSSSLLGESRNNNNSSSKPTTTTRVKGSLVLADEGGRGGIPKSILQESKEAARANRKSAYEADLQKAMLMSMEVGGGSVMGVGDNANNNYTTSNSSLQQSYGRSVSESAAAAAAAAASSSSDLTREEEEQLAMATALSLSEQEARQGKSTARSKSSSYQRNKSDSDDSVNAAGYLPMSHLVQSSKPPPSAYPSSHHSNSSYYATSTTPKKKSNLSEWDDDFDGGGKMPAQPRKQR